MFERYSFEKFHHDERLAFMLPDLMNGADVGMIERGGGARLAPESFERLWVSGYALRQKLQRNKTAELDIFGFINHAHTAAAKFFDDSVVRYGRAEHAGRCYVAA